MMSRKRSALLLAVVLTVTAAAATINAAAAPSEKEVYVFDKDQTWTDSAQIDIFARNELGNQIVYPGVTGYYSFTVKNQSISVRECEVVIEDDNKFQIPLAVRMKRDGVYVLGSDTEWVHSVVFDSGVYDISPESENTYEIEWKWDYYISDDLDSRDTSLGKQARYENEPYNIKITAYADTELIEISEPSESSNPSEPSSPSVPSLPDRSIPNPSNPGKDHPLTGDTVGLMVPFIVLMSSAIIALAAARKKKSD